MEEAHLVYTRQHLSAAWLPPCTTMQLQWQKTRMPSCASPRYVLQPQVLPKATALDILHSHSHTPVHLVPGSSWFDSQMRLSRSSSPPLLLPVINRTCYLTGTKISKKDRHPVAGPRSAATLCVEHCEAVLELQGGPLNVLKGSMLCTAIIAVHSAFLIASAT